MALTVAEASAAYERGMRNPLRGSTPGICAKCKTFVDPEYDECVKCHLSPDVASVVVPITYSLNQEVMHNALRGYKDGEASDRRYAAIRLAAILWRFLKTHERCIERAAGVNVFELVTVVPSRTAERDERRGQLRLIVGSWVEATASRFERVLEPTGEVSSEHEYDNRRYRATRDLAGENVLLIDDTWTTGGNAQSAAHALLAAGVRSVAILVIGRHVQPAWTLAPGGDETSGDRFKKLSSRFDWDTCCVHDGVL